MANIEEMNAWEEGIYQFEETDFIEGGANGIDNLPHKQLGARTKWLKVQIETLTAELNNLTGNSYTKEDIDTLLQGLKPKASVRVATTANITLSGAQSIDGIAVIVGERVLVKNQTSAAQNGIYIVAAGAWTRALDANSASELVGASVFIEQGTTNNDTMWVQTTDNITLDTTPLAWVKFAGNGAFQASSSILAAIAALTTGIGYLKFNNGAVSLENNTPTNGYVDVTASRTLGVVYTNTTNKTIELKISADSSAGVYLWVEINGFRLEGGYLGSRIDSFFLVHPGDTYKITTSSGAVPNDFFKVYERN